MNFKSFTYWLQGFFELSDIKTLNEKQVQLIKQHLALVLIHVPETTNPIWINTQTIIDHRKCTQVSDQLFEDAVC